MTSIQGHAGLLFASGIPYTYFRINITANNGDPTYTAIGCAQLYIGSTLLVVNTTSQSDYYGPGNNTSLNMWTNTTGISTNTSAWVSDGVSGFPHWVSARLNPITPTVITKYLIYPQAGLVTRAPKTFQLQGSTDGTTWVNIDSRTNITSWTSGTANTFIL